MFHHAAAAPLAVMDILTGFLGERMKEEVEQMITLLNQPNAEAQTALHLACQVGANIPSQTFIHLESTPTCLLSRMIEQTW